jgi:hypothetical protein
MAKQNKYQKKATKNQILSRITQPLPTNRNIANSAIETGKDLIIGVVAGGFTGAMIGRPSLLAGILVTGAGHYIDNRLLSTFGIGMMASNGFQSKGVQGVDGMEGLDGVKERVMAYKDNFLQKTYIDKVKSLTKKKAISGLDDVQYFSYPDNLLGSNDDFDALNRLENQIVNSGMKYAQVSGIDGTSTSGWDGLDYVETDNY